MKNGDLEKYLGSKYARDLSSNPEMMEVYQEADDILYGSMDAMSMMNKVYLAIKAPPQQKQTHQGFAGA